MTGANKILDITCGLKFVMQYQDRIDSSKCYRHAWHVHGFIVLCPGILAPQILPIVALAATQQMGPNEAPY